MPKANTVSLNHIYFFPSESCLSLLPPLSKMYPMCPRHMGPKLPASVQIRSRKNYC